MEQNCKHYKNKFKNIYLCNIDELKYITNNSKYSQHYFNTVNV